MGKILEIISELKIRLAGLKIADHIRVGFSVMAVMIVGYAAADTAMNVSRMEIPKRPEAKAAARSSVGAAQPADYNIIMDRNYFGSSSKPVAGDLKYKSDYSGSSGSPSTAQLDLLGTIADESGRGYAIIEERDKKSRACSR